MQEAGRYCLFETALGAFGIAWSESGLTRLQLPEADRCTTERRLRARSDAFEAEEPSGDAAHAIGEIKRYVAGERVDFRRIWLDLAGVDAFSLEVYRAARAVGWGETATYGEIARQLGRPREAREVGQALGRNPVAIIIPCHRVLAKGMKIGGFSAHGGTLTKRRLLELEGVDLDRDAPFLPGLSPEPRPKR